MLPDVSYGFSKVDESVRYATSIHILESHRDWVELAVAFVRCVSRHREQKVAAALHSIGRENILHNVSHLSSSDATFRSNI